MTLGNPDFVRYAKAHGAKATRVSAGCQWRRDHAPNGSPLGALRHLTSTAPGD